MATGNSTFLRQAEETFFNVEQYETRFYWGDKTRAAAVSGISFNLFPSFYK